VEEKDIEIGAKAFFTGTNELFNFAEKFVIPVINNLISPKDSESVIVGVYNRMFLHLHVLKQLNEFRDFQTVMLTTRSIFELFVDLKILNEGLIDDAVERYCSFHDVSKMQYAQKVFNFKSEHPEIEMDTRVHEELLGNEEQKKKAAELKNKYWPKNKKIPDHWTSLDMRKRCEHIDKKYLALYCRLYPMMSWYVHSGPSGHIGLDEWFFKAVFAKGNELSAEIFLEGTVLMVKKFHIDKALNNFPEIVKILKTVPGTVLLNESEELFNSLVESNRK
jgi:hypothetical protein